MTRPTRDPNSPASLRVETLPALQLAQQHLQSPNPATKAAAETLFSYLIQHLRLEKCEITHGAACAALNRLLTNK